MLHTIYKSKSHDKFQNMKIIVSPFYKSIGFIIIKAEGGKAGANTPFYNI